jgi:PPP family 3-phenylpropionic acid transporter
LRSSTAVSAYYFLLFGAIGVFWPNYAPFLEELGLSSSEAATIVAISPLMGMLLPQATSLVADALRAREWMLRILSAGAAVAFCGWFFAKGAPAIVWGTALTYSICRAPLSTLADASAFEAVRRGGGSFGRVRLWGSIGFGIAALVGGLLLQHWHRHAMVATTVAGLAAAAAFTWVLPAPPAHHEPRAFRAWLSMLRLPDLWPYLAAVFLAYVANGALDACFSMRYRHLGYSATFVSAAWAIGVVAEVLLMWWSRDLIARWGADRLLVIATGVAAARWLMLAYVTSPLVLALQPLHGITFGCLYVAGATIARDRAPAEAPTAAQGLFNCTASAGSATGMVVSGRIFQHHGGRLVFEVAAAVAAASTIAAIAYVRASRARAAALAAQAARVRA